MKTITYDESQLQLVPKEMTEDMGKAGANEWLVSNSQLDWYRALLSAAPQPVQTAGVPEGWQLVPKVATSEMIGAANECEASWKSVYPAMLAAAPQPVAQDRCPYCDGTGHAHRADGEWIGTCNCKESEGVDTYGLKEPVAQEEQKPVAWMMITPSKNHHVFIESEKEAKRYAGMDNRIVNALYAAPPSSVQAYNEGLEAAAKKVDEIGPKDGSLSLVTKGFSEEIRALKKTQEQQVAPAGEEK